jgi:hypothetical protein
MGENRAGVNFHFRAAVVFSDTTASPGLWTSLKTTTSKRSAILRRLFGYIRMHGLTLLFVYLGRSSNESVGNLGPKSTCLFPRSTTTRLHESSDVWGIPNTGYGYYHQARLADRVTDGAAFAYTTMIAVGMFNADNRFSTLLRLRQVLPIPVMFIHIREAINIFFDIFRRWRQSLVHGMRDIFYIGLRLFLLVMHSNPVLGFSLFQTKRKRQKTETKSNLILLLYIVSICDFLCFTHSVDILMFET